MPDFTAARRMMVDGQVRPSDVTDAPLIAAMQKLPRERFVPAAKAEVAYLDLDIAVSEAGAGAAERRLLKPMVLAKLIQAAEIGASDRVLDVGCATGYSAALLAHLAGAVVALEQDSALASRAAEALGTLGLTNVEVVTGPLREGYPSRAPYDAIVLEGATEIVPTALIRQLKPGGRLVGVLGRGPMGKAMLYRAVGTEVSGRPIFDAAAPLLPGFAKPEVFVF